MTGAELAIRALLIVEPGSDCDVELLQPFRVEACLRILQVGQFGCEYRDSAGMPTRHLLTFCERKIPMPAHIVIGHKSGRWDCPQNDTKKTQSGRIHYG
jgi:hypothetical protein